MKPQKGHRPQNTGTTKKYTGTLQVTSRGMGYVTVPELEHDVEIAEEFIGTALTKDTVELFLLPGKKDKPRGKIINVIKRHRTRFVGVTEKQGSRSVLKPDDKKIHVVFDADKSVSTNQKAYFELTSWKLGENPQAKIIKILGEKGDNDVEMESILLERGFNATFDVETVDEAERIRETAPEFFEKEVATRRDFRNTGTFTIDPKDAKDFDDAISFKKLPNGNFEIGVHIADVSHYVRPKSVLDREAQHRGVSIYLVDRTIPMLPEALSSDLCSLNPNEDKLTFSAVFEMTPEAQVKERWFGRTIIRSGKRFTYEEAQQVLDTKEGAFAEELAIINELAKKLSEERFLRGAISFEQDEVKFELDENGRPLKVFRKVRTDSHKLIEEFMLLANREVATYVNKIHHKTHIDPVFVYRVHDYPDTERIIELGIFLKAVGYELNIQKGKVTAQDLNALFKEIEGEAEEGMIKTAAIRSMAKAIYSTNNIGHYGLGFEYYTHFTSPIRRYADVLVHRLLAEYLAGRKVMERDFAFYENMSARVTESEIRATEAERDSIKLKQVEYMNERIGQTFEGIVSGVTEWGIYIEEKETKCEGMIKMRDLDDDYYNLDQKNYRLVGERNKKSFALGDSVRFKVAAADVERKTLDYKLAK